MVFDLTVTKTVTITDVKLRRLYVALMCTAWIGLIVKLVMLREAYDHIVFSDKAWVFLKEFGHDAGPASLNEALNSSACDPLQLQKYDYIGSGKDVFVNHSCIPICESGGATEACFQAANLRLYDGRDIAWFPTHCHREIMLSDKAARLGREASASHTSDFILPYIDRLGFSMDLTWDLRAELSSYDLSGKQTLWRRGEKELAEIGDLADNILLVVIESGDVPEPRKLLEFKPSGHKHTISFTVPQILELAGAADLLDTAQPSLAETSEEAPLGRVSGVEILLDIQCSNAKDHVVPASIELDTHDWDKHFCVMTATPSERWTYMWDTDSMPYLTMYNSYHGVRIGTRVYLSLDVISISALYFWAIAAVVVLQWPANLVIFIMNNFLGRWSRIYSQALGERFNVIRAVSSMATRLIMNACVLEQIRMGEPEITQKTIAARIARALDTHDSVLADEEKTNVSNFVYNAIVHHRKHDDKTIAANLRSFFCDCCQDPLWTHHTSPQATVSQEQCLNALSAGETIQFDQFCVLFDRDTKLTLGERLVYPRELRAMVWRTDDKQASGEEAPVTVVSPQDTSADGSACGTPGRPEQYEPQSEPLAEPSASLTQGRSTPRDDCWGSHPLVEQLREEMAQQAKFFRKELERQADLFHKQMQGLREEVLDHRAADLSHFAALSHTCSELRRDVSERALLGGSNGRNGAAVPPAVAEEAGTPGDAAELGQQETPRDAGARSSEARTPRDGAIAVFRPNSTLSLSRASTFPPPFDSFRPGGASSPHEAPAQLLQVNDEGSESNLSNLQRATTMLSRRVADLEVMMRMEVTMLAAHVERSQEPPQTRHSDRTGVRRSSRAASSQPLERQGRRCEGAGARGEAATSAVQAGGHGILGG